MLKTCSWLGGFIAISLIATSCKTVYDRDAIQEPIMPVAAFELPRRTFAPYSLKFRLAMFNFVDQTGAGGSLVKTIPDMLTTGVHNTGRFDLLDRGQLREMTINDLELQRQKLHVDGMLQGAITQIRGDDKKIVCDIRVTNHRTNAIMFAKSAEFRYSGTIDVVLNRNDITQFAKQIANAFPTLTERQPAKVISVSGKNVTISVGVNKGIKTGMTALVYTQGDLTRDLDSEEVLNSVSYLAQISVISPLDRISKAQRDEGLGIPPGLSIRVGDLIMFK